MKKTSGSAIAVVQFCLPVYFIVYAIVHWSTLSLARGISIIVVAVVIAVLFFGYWNDVRKLLSIIDKYERSQIVSRKP